MCSGHDTREGAFSASHKKVQVAEVRLYNNAKCGERTLRLMRAAAHKSFVVVFQSVLAFAEVEHLRGQSRCISQNRHRGALVRGIWGSRFNKNL